MRDRIKDKEYFEEYIKYEENRLNKRLNLIDQVIQQRGVDDSVRKAYLSILNYSMNIINSSYSIGMESDKILKELNNAIKINSNTSFIHGYIELLWMLSIGIMLEIDDEEFNKLKALVEKYNPQDYLVDFLIHYRDNSWAIKNHSFKFDEPYKALAEVINLAQTDKQKSIERLKQYLEKEWYNGHSDTGWHDSHKSEHDIYSGYWCWESGALVKILELDDTILKDQQFYPYDMVHAVK